MKMLSLVVIVGAVAFGGYVSAQDQPEPSKPVYTSEAMLRRIALAGLNPARCVLPDSTTELSVNSAVTVEGKTYRCVEVLNNNFQRIGVAWTPVSSQP